MHQLFLCKRKMILQFPFKVLSKPKKVILLKVLSVTHRFRNEPSTGGPLFWTPLGVDSLLISEIGVSSSSGIPHRANTDLRFWMTTWVVAALRLISRYRDEPKECLRRRLSTEIFSHRTA